MMNPQVKIGHNIEYILTTVVSIFIAVDWSTVKTPYIKSESFFSEITPSTPTEFGVHKKMSAPTF